MNKFDIINKVLISDLNKDQKLLLVELVMRSNENGESFPSTARLCKVLKMKHQKNFKGVEHYIGDFVTVTKRQGRLNKYILNYPALEGLSEAEVVIKQTPYVPKSKANEDTTTLPEKGSDNETELDNHPANADDHPADEGYYYPADADNYPSDEGAYSSIDNTRDNSIESTKASSDDSAFLDDNYQLGEDGNDGTSSSTVSTAAEGGVQDDEPLSNNEVDQTALDESTTEAVKVVVTSKDEALKKIDELNYIMPVGFKNWSAEKLWKYIEDLKEW